MNMFPGVFTGPKLLINREPVASQEFAAELLGDCDTICAQLAAASGIGAISHRDMQEQEQEQEEDKKKKTTQVGSACQWMKRKQTMRGELLGATAICHTCFISRQCWGLGRMLTVWMPRSAYQSAYF